MIHVFPALAAIVFLFPAPADLHQTLEKVSERIENYYNTLTNVVATERVTQQELDDKLQAKGKPQQFVYDLTMTRETVAGQSGPVVRIQRKASSAPGTAHLDEARPCTDPAESYTEPLAFLRANQQSEFSFSLGNAEVLDGKEMTVIHFAPARAVRTTVSHNQGCFKIQGQMKGTFWVDPSTSDVIRLRTELNAPIEFRTRGFLGKTIRVKTIETITSFRRVVFTEPDQALLLPERAETLRIAEGARRPRIRITYSYEGYRRFLATVTIKGGGEP